MYVVPPNSAAISLFNRAGFVRAFASRAHAYRELGYSWISAYVGSHFRTFPRVEHYADEPSCEVYQVWNYILLDENGDPLTAEDFSGLRRSKRKSRHQLRFALWNGEGPVPGTRKRGGGGGHYFRRVRTTSERRQAQHVGDEGEPAPRAARSPSNIPNTYDDIHSHQPTRSWKKYRRQQWKA